MKGWKKFSYPMPRYEQLFELGEVFCQAG